MNFEDIPGLKTIKQSLKNALENGHVAHALLFAGKPGSANLALALAYATYLNGTSIAGENVSPHVGQQFDRLVHPDLHFIYPTATNKDRSDRKQALSMHYLKEFRSFLQENPYGTLGDWSAFFGATNKQCIIPKEESRNIVKALSIKAFEARYKIMLIWLPELMHPAAANAILKVLEEPPPQTVFMLVSNQPNELLNTIFSRTQPIYVSDLSDEETAAFLQQKGETEERALQIAQIAGGNIRTAISLRDTTEDSYMPFFRDWMRACFKFDYLFLLKTAEEFHQMGREAQKGLFQYGLNTFHQVFLWKVAQDRLLKLEGEQITFVKNFSAVVTDQNIEQLAGTMQEGIAHIERNALAKLTFLSISLQLTKAMQKPK